MKVLLINNNHFITGGADSVYLNTGKLLEKYGNTVIYYSRNDKKNIASEYNRFYPEKIDFRNLSFIAKVKNIKNFIYNKEAKEKLLYLIDLYKPDVAHIHNYLGGLSNSILEALREKNIAIVLTIHDYRLICPAYNFIDRKNNICEKCKDGRFIRCAIKKCSSENKFTHSLMLSLDAYYRKYFQNIMKYINHYIFVSNFSYQKHVEFNNSYSQNSTQLYNFFPEEIQKNNIKGKYYLYFGRLSREKGIITLLNVFKDLNLELIIAGSGPLENIVKEYSDKLRKIKYIGSKNYTEIKELIKNCYFVIIPSEWYENNPMTIIETFSLGKPVVGSNIGGIPELLRDGRGFLFETKNKKSLIDILEKTNKLTEEEYFQICNKAYNFAKTNFSEKQYYLKLIEVYNKAKDDQNILKLR
mgnify:CR=1 FL=1